MSQVQLALDVSDVESVNVKVSVKSRLVGTIHIQKQGLAFSKPNAKKPPEGAIDWDKLPALIALNNGYRQTLVQ